MTAYQYPMHDRLQPVTTWTGGRVTDTDVLELAEAAAMASAHAGVPISIKDILRAAGRGEIPLRAIIRQSAKTEPCRADDALLNYGEPLPKGSIQTLPLTASQALANTGRADWRTFDWFEQIDGVMMRFTRWKLTAGEPDFETVPDDCRVLGGDLHALADAFKNVEAMPASTGPDAVVVVAPAPKSKNAKYSDLLAPRIDDAQKLCLDPFDAREVWPHLLTMAEQKAKPLQEVTDEGLKWTDGPGNVQFFTLKALRDRLTRQKKPKKTTLE